MVLRSSFTSLLRQICILLSVVLFLSPRTLKFAHSLDKSNFYPFGVAVGDAEMAPADDASSEEVPFSYGSFTYYQVEHKKVYVNLNGLVSFDTELPFYHNQLLSDFTYSLIAVLYADVDTHLAGSPDVKHGQAFYRITNDTALLKQFKQKVVSNFQDSKHFEPRSMLIATWDQVGYFTERGRERYDHKNTFQIVLAQGRLHSFVEFLYADDGLQWTTSDGKEGHNRDIPGQIGFVNDDGRNFLFNVSGKPEVSRVTRESNMGVPGDYLFRVSGDFIVSPKDAKSPSEPETEEADEEYYSTNVHHAGTEDYYEEMDDHDAANESVTTLAPAPPVVEPEVSVTTELPVDQPDLGSTTPADGISTSSSTGDEATGMTESTATEGQDVSTVSQESTSALSETDSTMLPDSSSSSLGPMPFCPDGSYQNGCPPDCTEQVTPPGCIQCKCPDTEDDTTAMSTQTAELMSTDLSQLTTQMAPGAAGASEKTTCLDADPSPCHQSAQCHNFGTGFCCRCSDGFYGNGIDCLPNGVAQRINGKVYGKLNGIDLPEMNLHTYAEPSDGRAYTAVSQIEPQTGRSFLFLNTLGNVMGWLFAKPATPGAYNGLELTGARFNRTATVHVGDSHTVTITEEFTGTDTVAKVYVIGTLPELPANTTIDFGEYIEEFNRAGPGVVKSYSTSRVSVITGPDTPARQYSMTVDQTIRYDECRHQPFDKPTHVVLKTERSYVYYEEKEKIVRYASANSVGARPSANEDPCRSNDCNQPHMTCVSQQNTYKCLCLNGYELVSADSYDRKEQCVDVDECAKNLHRCDSNAVCQNSDGSYTCSCNPGFRGTGFKCLSETGRQPPAKSLGGRRRMPCGEHVCHPDGRCRWDERRRVYYCQCSAGFYGDGYSHCKAGVELIVVQTTTARPIVVTEGQICSSHQECHVHGACVYNRILGYYHCQCRPPYTGDGRECVSHGETCDKAKNCDRNADCVYVQNELGNSYICRCKAGFSGDGYSCVPSRTPTQVRCNILNNCSPSAQCVFASMGHVCQCKPGFKGDGYRCEPETPRRPCRSQEDCHVSGHCVNRENRDEYFCECLPGFKGDGVTVCEQADECNPGVPNNTCAPNAHCMYDDREMAYVCRCERGYEGDGRRACNFAPAPPPFKLSSSSSSAAGTPRPHPLPEASCRDDPAVCNSLASCVPVNPAAGHYACRCPDGYKGDGYLNCERERALCNVENICDSNARCEPDNRGQHQCRCNPGYEGDGLHCKQIEDCLQNFNLCDRNAECVPDVSRYTCRCKAGFHGSGTRCTSDEDLRDKSIVFAQGMSLLLRGLRDTDTSKNLVIVPQQIAVGLDFDCRATKLYWTDVAGHALRCANADGSNVTLVADKGLESPEGIAVDYTSGNVYYADSQSDTIGVMRADGQYNYPLVKEGLVNPRALAIDFIDKKLYYTDWNRERPVIGRVNLDGTQRETFLADDIALPNGLAILHRRRELCWVDAGKQRLECTSVHGSGRRVVFAPTAHPFGLTVLNEETLYWTDWEDKKIHSISVYGSDHKMYSPSVGSSAKMYGITALHDDCPHADSPCQVNNGECKYLCLPDSRGSRRCVCPENVLDQECNVLSASLI